MGNVPQHLPGGTREWGTVPETLLNQTPVLGGAGTVYQRKEDGPWYLYFWVKAERKRFRQSLETTDRALAIRTGEQIVLDALARQQAGQKVLSSTLGEVIDKWEVIQGDRLARGEIRSAEYVRQLAATFRKQLGGLFGLDIPISALKQEDWDRYIKWRGDQGVALDTIRVECSHIRGLIGKVGMKLGARLVPELNVFVPKHARARRHDTFTAAEFHALLDALEQFIEPDAEGTYQRDWGLGAAKARVQVPKVVNQDLERSRRELLRWFVLVASSSGCRPHELAGSEEGSLRWKDVELKEVAAVVPLSQPRPTPKTIALLHIREMTKTGARVVPTVAGGYLRRMREWSRFAADDDYVFCDQYGIRAGKPVYMDSLRLQWQELLRRMGFRRFSPDLYTLRHMWATRRLEAGAPPALIAKSLGHSMAELLKTYEHIDFQQEGVIRAIWQDRTPEVFRSMGIVVADPDELNEL